MSDRELVIEVAKKMPVNTPLADIIREIAFVAGVNEGIAASDRGDVVSIEEARRLIKQWTSKSS